MSFHNSVDFVVIFTILAVVFLGMVFAFFKKINSLKKEIKFHKKIIESKSKSFNSANRKKVFEKSLILSFTEDGVITSVNAAFSDFLGFEEQELIGQNIVGSIIPEKDSNGNDMTQIVKHFVANPKLYIDIETEVCSKSKKSQWVSWTNRAIYDADGNITSFTCVGFDVTARKILEKELAEVSSADVIAGVYNKMTFTDVANKELMRATRYNRDLSLVVFIVHRSLHYKGEEHNDFFLQKGVDVCKSLIRDCDYIGRIGDNEFALLLPETQLSSAEILINRINNKVKALADDENNPFVIDSLGVGERQAGDESIDKLILRAFNSLQNIVS